MDDGHNSRRRPAGPDPVEGITAAIRELAYASWAGYQAELRRDTSRALFERVYLGHYSSIDMYVVKLVDDYELDAKLDEAIAEPFRQHVTSTSTPSAAPSSTVPPSTPSWPCRSGSGYSTKSNRQGLPMLWNPQSRSLWRTIAHIISDEMPRTSLTPDQAQQLGTLLRKRRAALNMSLRQVAQLTGLTISTLSEIETGVNLSPQPDTLKALARGLGLAISDLYVLADWLPADELPTLKPYLRAKYSDLDEQAIADLEAYAERLAKRHGGLGPIDGEDEQP